MNFESVQLDPNLINDLRRLNPWWEGNPLPALPTTRRNLVNFIHRRLRQKLAPIIVTRGPRQVGKTTAQLQVLSDLLAAGVPPRNILRVQCDELTPLHALTEPLLRVVDWYEAMILGQTLNAAARAGEKTYLFFDEVQTVSNWAPQLKFLVDASTTQILATGSSALQIEMGRDSLAGRITTLEAGTLSLTEVGHFRALPMPSAFLPDNGLEPLTRQEFWKDLREYGLTHRAERELAFQAFSERGSYPLAHQASDSPWPQVADQLNETVIKRVIQHDLPLSKSRRQHDQVLLEELFRLACRYIGQAPDDALFARELKRALQSEVVVADVRHFMQLLSGSLLLRLIEPLEMRLKKKRGSAKICLVDHGLRASWLQEQVPLAPAALAQAPHLSDLAGHIAESVVGATLSTIGGLDLAHFPQRPSEPEIDFVLTIGTLRIPLEVKYRQRLNPLADTEGLRTFLEKTVYNAPFALLITQTDEAVVTDPRIVCLPLSSLMLLR